MALIECPECGHEISDKAEVCIHCGYPLAALKNTPQESVCATSESREENSVTTSKMYPQNFEEKRKSRRNAAIAVAVVVAVIIVLVAVIEYSQHSYTRAQRRAQEAVSSYQTEKSKLDSLEREKAAVDATIDALESNK